MNGYCVWKQYDTEKPAVHLWNRRPSANPPIRLDEFAHRRLDDTLNPFVANESPVRAKTHRVEVSGELHEDALSEASLQGKRAKIFSRPIFLPDPFFSQSLFHAPFPHGF